MHKRTQDGKSGQPGLSRSQIASSVYASACGVSLYGVVQLVLH